MNYDISEYINPKDPLYIKGCTAIKKHDNIALDEVINHPDFDCESFEARALLFYAAETVNFDAFHKLGDANVLLFNPLKILRQRPHVLDKEIECSDVYLTYDTTPLHTLLQKMNLRVYEKLNLAEHFQAQDIERTLNTYSFKAKGTPLDIAWERHSSACNFLTEQAKREKQHILELPADFFYFYMQCLYYVPDMTAPTIAEKPLIYQRAIQKKDILTLRTISDHTVYCLNTIGYKFNKNEYEMLCPFTDPELVQEMKKGFEEKIIQRTSFLNKAKLLFSKLICRQKD